MARQCSPPPDIATDAEMLWGGKVSRIGDLQKANSCTVLEDGQGFTKSSVAALPVFPFIVCFHCAVFSFSLCFPPALC